MKVKLVRATGRTHSFPTRAALSAWLEKQPCFVVTVADNLFVEIAEPAFRYLKAQAPATKVLGAAVA